MNNIIYLSFILIFICFSCNQKSQTKITEPIEDYSYKGSGKYYFDFDAIEHYSLAIDIRDVDKKANNPRGTMEVLYRESEFISDTLYIDSLTDLNFNKYSINKIYFDSINQIFRDKYQPEIMGTTCIPWFSDILVFKKSNSISGVAKVCFHCLKHNIVGSKTETRGLGQSNDYEKLEQILIKNKGQ
ncbi:hypothetical protein B739_0247 [Sporocytophaga myxococcoides]|uniref:Uncharacterized protein n=1 Tax=Sporocytophaga myxococcoides TaxID=153721 RepID=A0A098LN91_9BACT|nr:hypothetical protein [Sporocytophaga myxococcoides]GAL87792.1 hypothetical protein B739_0247 [Sporocytophaga myxococcoides]